MKSNGHHGTKNGESTISTLIAHSGSRSRPSDGLRASTRGSDSSAELRAQLQEASENSVAVAKVVGAIETATTVDTAARAALQAVREAFGWAYGSYWTLDPKEKALKFAVESGSVNDEFRRVTAEARFREGEGLSGRAWKSRDLVFVPDLGEMRDCCRAPIAQRAGVKSGVCLPIVIDGKVAGTMDFFATTTLELSAERTEALRNVGRLVSNAIRVLYIAEQTAARAADADAVRNVIQRVGVAQTIDGALTAALDTVREAFGWAYGSYWTLDPKEKSLKFAVESGSVNDEFRRVTAEARFREGEGLSGRAWKSRDLVFVPDLGEVRDCCRAPVAQRAGVKSGVCLPIVIDGKVAGTMDFFATTTLELSAERTEALRNVGRLVSNALHVLQVAEESAQAAADGRAINQVVEAVIESSRNARTPLDAARGALAAVREAFGWAYGSYWVLDPKDKVLKFAVESGSVNDEFRRVTMEARFREGEGLSGRTWKSRDLVFVPDLGEMRDCCRAPIAQRAGVKSGVCMPIAFSNGLAGTMDFFAMETLNLSSERLEALRNVGRLVSTSMETLEMNQRLSVVIEKVSLTCQHLTGVSQELGSSSETMSATASETAAQATTVSAGAEQVSTNVQTVASGVEEMGASIKEIANNAAEAAKVASVAVSVADRTNNTVAQLGESSAEIGKVIKVITSIAGQTNLLALNATIEAARAGEAGKGFAVVANEVKELAKETAKATEDISQKIEAIQRDTHEAVQAIDQIGAIIKQINEIQGTIASAVEEQTATTAEIARNITEAAKGSSEIARNITAVAEAAGVTTESATGTRNAARQLAQLAGELQDAVSRSQ